MKKSRNLPIGVDDFKDLRQGYYFVDKTGFIQNLIDGHSKVTLFTRPRRFGKTLTLSMLYYFFTLEHAEEHRKLFDGCFISQAGESYMTEQGTRPVVMFSMKDIKAKDYSSMIAMIAEIISTLYGHFRFLLKEDLLAPEERAIFLRMLDKTASNVDLQFSLKRLMQYLSRYHHRPVLLLIDEYDAPMQYAWDNGYYEDAITFLRNFLSAALKTNPYLDFAILTGVLRIAKESIFSSLNNLDVSSVAYGSYPEVFGFSKAEIEQMTADFGCTEKLPEIQLWYDGYNFSGKEIYNPWSVINYFGNGFRPGLYWVNTSSNSILAELLKLAHPRQKQELRSLLQRESIRITIDEGIIYVDIHQNKNALYTILLTTGYLTTTNPPVLLGSLPTAELRIPNREVRSVYASEILNQIDHMGGASSLPDLLDDLLNGRADAFATGLNDYLETIASYYDTANRENFYHGFLLGLLALLVPDYAVRSNRESGYGRFDIAIFPAQGQPSGILMEFKVADSEAELPAKAQEALAQIDHMDYLAEFRAQNINDVWKYGIAFCGKKTQIASHKQKSLSQGVLSVLS